MPTIISIKIVPFQQISESLATVQMTAERGMEMGDVYSGLQYPIPFKNKKVTLTHFFYLCGKYQEL